MQFILLLTICFVALFTNTCEWSSPDTSHPCLQEIINSPVMQRLKDIDQSGPLAYFGYCPFFSRYEHSVGVLFFVQKAGRHLNEQIAAVLHDASHTAFSHVADTLFKMKNHNHSYQDTVHLAFLKKHDVESIIGKYDLSIEDTNPDSECFKALERPLPALCADRIQYTIHTGLILNKISPLEAEQIIKDLIFIDEAWVFTTIKSAQQFAHLSLEFTKEFWGSPLNSAIYDCFVRILEELLQDQSICYDEIKYGVDMTILEKINISTNPKVTRLVEYLRDIHNHFEIVEQIEALSTHYLTVKPKFRGTDPLVQTAKKNTFEPLSNLDKNFKQAFYETKQWCERGYTIRTDW